MMTSGMEQYLKHMYRLSQLAGYTRVTEVAREMAVHRSSVSKMTQKLAEAGWIDFAKYGRISLTAKGTEIGERLLGRQQVLERFLELLSVPQQRIPQEAELLEPHFSEDTLDLLHKLVKQQ